MNIELSATLTEWLHGSTRLVAFGPFHYLQQLRKQGIF